MSAAATSSHADDFSSDSSFVTSSLAPQLPASSQLQQSQTAASTAPALSATPPPTHTTQAQPGPRQAAPRAPGAPGLGQRHPGSGHPRQPYPGQQLSPAMRPRYPGAPRAAGYPAQHGAPGQHGAQGPRARYPGMAPQQRPGFPPRHRAPLPGASPHLAAGPRYPAPRPRAAPPQGYPGHRPPGPADSQPAAANIDPSSVAAAAKVCCLHMNCQFFYCVQTCML